MQQKRQEMITLLRGQVASPLLANLAEFGWLEQMSGGSFSIANFPYAKPPVAKAVFHYLASVGLIIEQSEAPEHYTASDFGRSVFARVGAFCILNSYEDFFQDLRPLLFDGTDQPKPRVNRLRNVFGSGQLHSRKFFSPALQMLAGRSFPFVVDLGCGNGQFLQQAADAHLSPKLGGVDVSSLAVMAATATINQAKSRVHLHAVEADASGVHIWSNQLPWFGEAGLFSLWFVLHEFSQQDPQVVLRFLREINSYYPSAEVIIGELVRLPEHALANNRTDSIMPEFLFFHALSGQGVLSWTAWQEVRIAMPFQIVRELYFDTIVDNDGNNLPSSFIWHLKPF
jgi:SAM-dependent methyltransferase